MLGNLLSGVTAKRLLILPDGPLNSLPFAALPLPHGHAREQLIDRFVIARRAFAGARPAIRPRERPAMQMRVAVISDPSTRPTIAG